MAVLNDFLQGIANSIRKIKGTSGNINAQNFFKEIESLAYVDNGNVTGVVPTKGASTITPSSTNQTISSGVYLTGNQTILGDSNLVPENILRGKSNALIDIFGVSGTADSVFKVEGIKDIAYHYGIQVADVAKSYHAARVNGVAFKYSQSQGLYNGQVTNSDGRCLLDCSGFIGLVLRGIDYPNSPFPANAGKANATCSPSIINTLCTNSNYDWANKYLDRQTDTSLKEYGIVSGYRSIRNTAQLAQYFYQQGCTLHEYATSPTKVPTDIYPGDLIFWSKATASDYQKSRFKAISHVAIVARDTSKFYQVTGSEDAVGDTVFCSDLAEKLDEITLIVRPCYHSLFSSTPFNTNLLPMYAWDSLSVSASTIKNGVTFKVLSEGGFSTQGVATASTTFYLYSSTNPITLSAGTYKLSGCPVHPEVAVGGTSIIWGLYVKDMNKNKIAADDGAGSTFTLTSDTDVYVYFYISASLKSTSTFIVKPSLIRTA